MNTAQAKQIPLRRILERLGHAPQHETRGEYWYNSPFRKETKPSFKINPTDNVWYDFGEGTGGNVLDFMMHLNRHQDISTALKELEALIGRPRPGRDLHTLDLFAPARSQERPAPEAKAAFTLTKAQPLQNRALIGYLESRGIAQETAAAYVQEVYYRRDDKPYFALGFPNDSGGYELRNPYFKGVLGTKDITLLRTAGNVTGTVAVFEGFMDFLSYLAHFDIQYPRTAVLVLNSVAMKDKAVETIQALNAHTIDLYLDNDEAGQNLTRQFQEQLHSSTVVDHSKLYAGQEDFNAFLVATMQQQHASGGMA